MSLLGKPTDKVFNFYLLCSNLLQSLLRRVETVIAAKVEQLITLFKEEKVSKSLYILYGEKIKHKQTPTSQFNKVFLTDMHMTYVNLHLCATA